MQAYKGEAEHVYVVTLSGKLSGSYNSAELGRNLYEEEHPGENKQIYVFNSRSASIGETIIGLKVQEFEEAGLPFEEVVARTEEYISSMNTYFVLETLETLRKNGRLTNLKALIANTLNIKPVMGSTKEGMICQLGQARGMNKALEKMVQEYDRAHEGLRTACACHRALQLPGARRSGKSPHRKACKFQENHYHKYCRCQQYLCK